MNKINYIFLLPLFAITACASGGQSSSVSSESLISSSSESQSSSSSIPTPKFKNYEVVTIQPFFSRMADIKEEPEKGWVLPEGVTNFNLLLNSAGNYLKNNQPSFSYKEESFYKDKVIDKNLFSKLGKNQIILFEGHGSFEKLPNGDPEMRSVMWTGQSYDPKRESTKEDYENYLLQGAGAAGGEEALNYYFVDEYLPDITGSIVYLGNCYSARECTFAQAFLRKGAAAVIGNSHTTQSAYSALMQYSTITNLIKTNPETNKPYTLYEAFMNAKSLYGATDQAKKPIPGVEGSEPILYGNPNYCLYDME